MKCLVYITNYEGNSKITYINKMLSSLNEIELDIDVIIYTTEELNLIETPRLKVEISIKPKVLSNSIYAKDWQPEPEFIWIYRSDMISKVNDYDLFIHLEDDILLNKKNVEQFIKYSYGDSKLDGYIVGNILYEREKGSENHLLPQFHAHFRGFGDIEEINGEYFLIPKNLHQASFMISQEQLKILIKNDAISETPKLASNYNIKCSAMSDIYCTKYLKKVVPLSNINNSLLEHLSGKYVKLNKIKGVHWYNNFDRLNDLKKIFII